MEVIDEVLRVRESVHGLANRLQDLMIGHTDLSGDMKVMHASVDSLTKTLVDVHTKLDDADLKGLNRRIGLLEKIVFTCSLRPMRCSPNSRGAGSRTRRDDSGRDCGAAPKSDSTANRPQPSVRPSPRTLDPLCRGSVSESGSSSTSSSISG